MVEVVAAPMSLVAAGAEVVAWVVIELEVASVAAGDAPPSLFCSPPEQAVRLSIESATTAAIATRFIIPVSNPFIFVGKNRSSHSEPWAFIIGAGYQAGKIFLTLP